jgi:Mrp family chromosome partitioning ATPase
MRQLVAEARERYDWVIVDLSPLGPSPDAHLVTALSDGAIVIVDAGTVPARVIQRVVDAIGEEKVIGVVMNRMPPAALGDAYGAYPDDYAVDARIPR